MALEIRDASVVYPAQAGRAPVEALSRINLTVSEHDFVVALGASGCGKSTLLNLIAGFLSPSSGQIVLDGTEVCASLAPSVQNREWRWPAKGRAAR